MSECRMTSRDSEAPRAPHAATLQEFALAPQKCSGCGWQRAFYRAEHWPPPFLRASRPWPAWLCDNAHLTAGSGTDTYSSHPSNPRAHPRKTGATTSGVRLCKLFREK